MDRAKLQLAFFSVAILASLGWLGGILDGVSWNYNYFASRIDNKNLAMAVGVFVNLSVAALFYFASKDQSKPLFVFAGLMAIGSILISIEAIDTKERKDELADYEHAENVLTPADSLFMATTSEYFTDANKVAQRGNRTLQVLSRIDSAGSVYLQQQQRRDSLYGEKVKAVEMANAETFPFIDWVGGLMLFGGSVAFSILAGIQVRGNTLKAKEIKDQEQKRAESKVMAAEIERRANEPDWQDSEAVAMWLAMKHDNGELTLDMISDVRRKTGWTQQRMTYWRRKVKKAKNGKSNLSKNGLFSLVSTNGKTNGANSITS